MCRSSPDILLESNIRTCLVIGEILISAVPIFGGRCHMTFNGISHLNLILTIHDNRGHLNICSNCILPLYFILMILILIGDFRKCILVIFSTLISNGLKSGN